MTMWASIDQSMIMPALAAGAHRTLHMPACPSMPASLPLESPTPPQSRLTARTHHSLKSSTATMTGKSCCASSARFTSSSAVVASLRFSTPSATASTMVLPLGRPSLPGRMEDRVGERMHTHTHTHTHTND